MNPDDAFERILASLHEAALDDACWQAAWALIDEACGIVGSVLAVGEAVGTDVPVHFARFYLPRRAPAGPGARVLRRVLTPTTRASAAS